MRRVLVLGCGGSGKSTFSRNLAKKTELPVIHLDKEFWLPGWKMPDKPIWVKKVSELVARPSWIMDGNHDSTLDIRIPRADTIIFFDFPVWRCLWGVFKRRWEHRNKPRVDMGPGCPEKIDWEFLVWIYRFRKNDGKRTLELIEQYGAGKRVEIFKSRAEARLFLQSNSENQTIDE
jgi:adenylate kinase family enzyme